LLHIFDFESQSQSKFMFFKLIQCRKKAVFGQNYQNMFWS